MENVKIIFKNGTKINAKRNGDSLITNEAPDFPEDLSVVTIQGTEDTKVINDAVVTECASTDGKYWFAFTQKSAEGKMQDKIRFLEDCMMEMSEVVYQ